MTWVLRGYVTLIDAFSVRWTVVRGAKISAVYPHK